MKMILSLFACLLMAGYAVACGGSSMGGGSFSMQSSRLVPIDPSLGLSANRWSSPAGLRIVQRADGSLVANSGSRRAQITERRLPLSAKGGLIRGRVARQTFPVAVQRRVQRVRVMGVCPT